MGKVAIVRCPDYGEKLVEEKVRGAIGLLGGIEKFISKGDKVLIKPNVLRASSPEAHVTTHPLIVKAVVKMVQEVGGIPTIMDMTWVGSLHSTKKALTETGLADVGKEMGVEVKGFEENGWERVKVNGKIFRELYAPKFLMNADKVISLPKMKTHLEGIITGAIKNWFGCVPMKFRKIGHSLSIEEIADAFVDVYLMRPPDLVLMDGVVGMEGNGPISGGLKKTGLLLASGNGVELDRVMVKIMGIDYVPMLKRAKERRIGQGEIEIVGEKLENVITPFKKPVTVAHKVPRTFRRAIMAVMGSGLEINKSKCTKCLDCVKYCPVTAIKFKQLPEIDMQKCILCFGCAEICPVEAIEITASPIKESLQSLRRFLKL